MSNSVETDGNINVKLLWRGDKCLFEMPIYGKVWRSKLSQGIWLQHRMVLAQHKFIELTGSGQRVCARPACMSACAWALCLLLWRVDEQESGRMTGSGPMWRAPTYSCSLLNCLFLSRQRIHIRCQGLWSQFHISHRTNQDYVACCWICIF